MSFMTMNAVLLKMKEILQEAFKEVPIYYDMPADTEIPYVLVSMVNSSQIKGLNMRYQRNYQFEIEYPRTNQSQDKLLEIVETCYEILECLVLDGYIVNAEEMEHELGEKRVAFRVSYSVAMRKIRDLVPTMSRIHQEGGVKE